MIDSNLAYSEGVQAVGNGTNFTESSLLFYLNDQVNRSNLTFTVENQTGVVATGVIEEPYSSFSVSGYLGYNTCYAYGVQNVTFYVNSSLAYLSDYNITVNATDSYGNSSKIILRRIEFIDKNPDYMTHVTILSDSNNQTVFNSSDLTQGSVYISFKWANYLNGSFDLARYTTLPAASNISSGIGKYITTVIDPNSTRNLQYAEVRLYYNSSDVSKYNISNESALAFYTYDSDTDSFTKVAGSYDNSTDHYIYMNTTHFSTYGVYEDTSNSSNTPSPSPPSSGSSGSGGGGGGYTIPVTTQNVTNSTHIVVQQRLDCSALRLPNGSTCNGSGVYIPPQTVVEERQVEVVREVAPDWSYWAIGALAVLSLVLAAMLVRASRRTV